MEEPGKKHTDSSKKLIGKVTFLIYEDSFEVKCTEGIDMLELYLVLYGAIDYINKLSEAIDKPESFMVH